MLMRAYRFLQDNPTPSEDEVRAGMSGNLCRCTGYQNIVKAVLYAADKMQQQQQKEAANERPTTAERAARSQGLGDSRLRKEDARFIQGKGNYVDDIKLPGMVHMDIVRSPVRSCAHQDDRQVAGARDAGRASPCSRPTTSSR